MIVSCLSPFSGTLCYSDTGQNVVQTEFEKVKAGDKLVYPWETAKTYGCVSTIPWCLCLGCPKKSKITDGGLIWLGYLAGGQVTPGSNPGRPTIKQE